MQTEPHSYAASREEWIAVRKAMFEREKKLARPEAALDAACLAWALRPIPAPAPTLSEACH